MIETDFKNIEDIQIILKYIDKSKFDIIAWSNTLELNDSLIKLINEHKDYIKHMEKHH